jgi:hypothetical protein
VSFQISSATKTEEMGPACARLSAPTSGLSEPQKRLMNLNACLVAQNGGAYEAANRKKA